MIHTTPHFLNKIKEAEKYKINCIKYGVNKAKKIRKESKTK
jgi:hypothetical protein